MPIIALTLLTTLLGLPQESSDSVRNLIRRLGSEKFDERTEASDRLKKHGAAALRELEMAFDDPDPEVSQRARRLVRVIRVAEQLTPRLRSTLPGIEEQLADGDTGIWCRVFLEIAALKNGKPAYSNLGAADFEALALHALRESEEPQEKGAICERIGRLKLRAAVPEL